ncbi:MAG: 1-acyl-sn-glycerol-3-phosphate acyltransferase [Bacteroidia bacterium]
MEDHTQDFDAIRPYHDEEVHQILARISHKHSFFQLIGYLFPQMTQAEVVEGFSHIHSIRAFQALYIHRAIRSIAADSTDGVTYEGLKGLSKSQPYLYLANHRDIILDSAFLNVLLFEHGFDTTQIAIGDNLMVSPLVTDLMKLNKSFIVHRSAPRHLMVPYAQRLSGYIRKTLHADRCSLWLAQRNGRTKDGIDETSPALLKMLQISGPDDLVASFQALHLVPVAISYEYEPCDGLKAEECYHARHGLPYTKDDKVSIVRGIRDRKGRVHLAVGQPLHDEIAALGDTTNRNAWFRSLAARVDAEIWRLYRRWPTHYIAADLLLGEARHAAHYSADERAQFTAYVDRRVSELRGDPVELRQILLEIYAGMVEPALVHRTDTQRA